MRNEELLEKLKLPGRQITREVVSEIQKDIGLFREDLLSILERESNNPQDPWGTMEYNDWLISIYLLAEVREKRAYPHILKLFSRSGNFLNQLTGDFALQNLGQVLASVASSDISAIKAMIENEALNEYSRAAGIEALVILVEIGELEREQVYQYFNELFQKLERKPSFPWTVLAQGAIVLFKKSFYKEVKHAFNSELIDEVYLDLEEVDDFLSNQELSNLALSKKKYGIIIDSVVAMDWWTNFKDIQ